MRYDCWLDYIEDNNEFPFMAYLCILRDIECSEFFIIGSPKDKIEWI